MTTKEIFDLVMENKFQQKHRDAIYRISNDSTSKLWRTLEYAKIYKERKAFIDMFKAIEELEEKYGGSIGYSDAMWINAGDASIESLTELTEAENFLKKQGLI